MKKASNKNLKQAKKNQKDEFYTQLPDIERELKHYQNHFKNKVVYCNCDDPRVSNFFHYFSYKFESLKLKKLITTCYKNQDVDLFSSNNSERAIYLEYEGKKNQNRIPDREEIEVRHLQGDGDFRSEECIELLKQSDIVVTNPPFSLFREYVSQLIEYEKKFIILGHQNAITYKETFKFIKENKIWLGVHNGGTKWFGVNNDYDIKTESRKKVENGKKYFSMGSVNWYTNLEIAKRNEELILYKTYTPEEYPTYDNYNAINVDKTKDIPKDYSGAMGVPITFLDKYNPDQFKIIKFRKGDDEKDLNIKGKYPYFRILIKNKQYEKSQ